MHVFNNAIIFKGSVRYSKPKRILLKHIRQLILKKHRLWKKIHDQGSLANYRAVCGEAKSAFRDYVSRREQELLKCHNQSAFYKYINRAISNRTLPVKLTDSSGNIVSPGIDTANIFNMEFAGNFSLINAPPISHDSSGHQFNITMPDTYTALCAAHSSSAGPYGVPGELLQRLAAVLALPLSIVFQQPVVQGSFPSSWKEAIIVPIYKGDDRKTKRRRMGQ